MTKRLFIKLVLVVFILTFTLQAWAEEERITFNFVGADLPAIAKFVSDLTGKNIIFDDQFKGKITIIAPAPIYKSEAFKLFTSVLELKGFTVISAGANTYKIITTAEAKQKGVDLTSDKILNENYIARLIQLEHISSDDAVKLLKPIMTKDGFVSEFSPRNMILVMDSGSNLEKILKIIKTIDRPSQEDVPDIIYLKNANAENLAKTINDGLKRGQTRPAVAKKGEFEEAYVVADHRLNAIVVFGAKSDRTPIKKLIGLLDVPSPEANGGINVYFLEHANAEELSKVLDNLIKKAQQQPQDKAVQRPQTAAFNSSADISVTPDVATNSLVIMASSSDYKNIVEVIKKLDRRRKQVYVEALIIEVSTSKLADLGMNWRGLGAQGSTMLIGGVGSISTSALQNVITGLSGFSIGGLGKFVDVPYSVTNADGSVTSSTLSVPGFAALFNISDFKDVINVLSTPQILTSDNKEAEIMVGENVPFVAKRESDPTRTASVFNSIERKDVGISLKITPHITEGDVIKLDVYQEISAVLAETNADITISLGPTTSKRSTKTTIFAKDNETIVIGGLLQEREENSVHKVPVLGDIPVLGLLFKQKETTKAKINLMVFLTPHIVDTNDTAATITNTKGTSVVDDYTSGKTKTEERVIVRFRDSVSKEQSLKIIDVYRARLIREFSTPNLFLIELPKGKTVSEAKSDLELISEVKYVEREYFMERLKEEKNTDKK
ncbi:MAG: type II secretion system secretin GspD [Nitrospirae bacterium]|nr:type II secretion system secretin GspD [Nitrospirota bacterium]